MRLRILLPIVAAVSVAGTARGQTNYTWNNTGSPWDGTTTSVWNPSTGVPTATDTALFNLLGTIGTAATVPAQNNPIVSGTQTVFQVGFGQTAAGAGWTVNGGVAAPATLVIGGTSSTGLTTQGTGVTAISGLSLAGASSTNTLGLSVGGGSELDLLGSTAVASNQGNLTIGGVLVVDNSTTNNTKLLNTGTVTVNGGGVFSFVGAAAGSSLSVGTLNAGSNVVGGSNTIRVRSNGGTGAVLSFANAAGTSLRPGTRGTYGFETPTGNLGDPNGARITLAGAPFLGANNLLANSAGGGTVGFAVVRDGLGTNWATYAKTSDVAQGLVSVANPNQTQATVTTVSDATGLASLTASSIGQLNAPAGAVTTTGTVTSGSLRISPAGAGGSLQLGSNGLATNALMLDGTNDYTITGAAASTLGGSGTRYVYVNNATTTLSTNIQVANGGNPTTFAGPGFVALTGTTSQNTLTTTNRFVIGGGVVRGNNTQIGFTSTGAGIISFNGGVLEITNGTNGTGATADFTRALGAAAGTVTWGAGTANESGPGGFSAFGAPASVNIGGAATPATLTWGATNFVPTGYALRFGSTQSNNTLAWQNPTALDTGTGGLYTIREVSVARGTGAAADRTVFSGVVSGSATTDLAKTGTGLLELAAANTYTGNTLVRGGVLLATNPTSATGGGSVLVESGGTLAGTGTLAPNSTLNGLGGNNQVVVFPGGTLAPGGVSVLGATATTTVTTAGTLTVNSLNSAPVAFKTGSTLRLTVLAGTSPATAAVNTGGSSTGSNNSVLAAGAASVTLSSPNIVVDLTGVTLTANGQYSFTVVTGTGLTPAGTGTPTQVSVGSFQFLNNGVDYTASISNPSMYVSADSTKAYVNFVFVPVPEPATVLAVAAVGLGGLRLGRRLTGSSRRPG